MRGDRSGRSCHGHTGHCLHERDRPAGHGRTLEPAIKASGAWAADGTLASVTIGSDAWDFDWDRAAGLTAWTNAATTTSLLAGQRHEATSNGTLGYGPTGDVTSGGIATSYDPFGAPDPAATALVGLGHDGERHIDRPVQLRARDLHPGILACPPLPSAPPRPAPALNP